MKGLLILTLAIMALPLLVTVVTYKEETVNKTENYEIVRVTTYTIDPDQTDDTPTITASGYNVGWKNPKKHRVIAISRDLLKKYKFGTKVKIKGAGRYDGVYRVEDVMNKRFKNRIDILINPKDKQTAIDNVKLAALQ